MSTQLLHLFRLSSSEIDQRCRDSILKEISFPSMKKRYNEVIKAHQETFTWILQHDRPGNFLGSGKPDAGIPVDGEQSDGSSNRNEQEDLRDSIRKNFRHWLSQGNGIFQIIAKPGAGKSTMMKFIYESTETDRLLREWSDGRSLIKANFFFWKQGAVIQRSMNGMTRALLHGILSQAPELIPHVLSEQWRTSQSTPWHCHLTPEISDEEAKEALKKVFSAQTCNIISNYSICIFLDGLDECESNRDSQELISSLQNLASLSDNIKLCVSSRVMNSLAPVDDAYPQQKIYLHNLTQSDIRKVARDRLNGHPSFQRMVAEKGPKCSDLIDRITSKAEGVFLWVTLILNILYQGLVDDDTLSDLWEKIEFYPDDLDEFIQQIVKSIPPENRKLAYRTFSIASMVSRYDRNLLLLNYSFLKDYTSNRDFTLAIPKDRVLSSAELATRLARTQKRLVAHCKELLQASHNDYDPDSPTVGFMHRSVRETFEQDQVKVDMAKYLKDFDVLDAILQTTHAAFKLSPMYGTVDTTRSSSRTTFHLGSVLQVIKGVESQCTTATYETLDSIAATILDRHGVVSKSFQHTEWARINTDFHSRRIESRGSVPSLVHQATSSGLSSDRDWTMMKFADSARRGEAATELLYCYVKCGIMYDIHDSSFGSAVWIEQLFRAGLSANCPQYSVAEYYGRPIWYGLLLHLVHRFFDLHRYYWHVFELFVRNGADCSLKMELMDGDGTDERKTYGGLVAWADVWVPVNKLGGVGGLFSNSETRVVELQDIVDLYKPENADLLKDLIARNQARERESPSAVTLSNRDFEEECRAAITAGNDPRKVKFRMREPNWDVSPPTAAEREAARLEKWATSGPAPYSSESGIDLALQDLPFLAWMMGYLILGVPVVWLILGTLLMTFLGKVY